MSSDSKPHLNLPERIGRWLVVASLFALPVVGAGIGCAPASDQVELRLFPCMFGDDQPRSVVVEITGYDLTGEIVETHEVSFDNISAGVFDDGYATAGYRPDAEVATASFRLGWSSSPSIGSIDEAEVVVTLDMLAVPVAGEVLELGDGAGGGCEPIAGDGDGDTTTTSGDGDGDTTTTSGDGDGDMTTTGDGDGDTTTTTSGDGDGDPTTTGDGDGDMTTTGDGDGDPVDLPMPGDPCSNLDYPFACIPEPGGEAGTPLYCNPVSEELEMTDIFEISCEDICPVGSSDAVDACAGFGVPGQCLCYPDVPESCNGAQLGCDGPNSIRLCFNGDVVVGQCNNCAMEGEYYTCG